MPFACAGVALLANAPERIPERKKRGKEREAMPSDSRPLPLALSSGAKLSSRAARNRLMAQREEQLAAQKVCVCVCVVIDRAYRLHNYTVCE